MSDFNLKALEVIETLDIEKSNQLLKAIKKNNNFNFIEARLLLDKSIKYEILVVDLECDGVPDANKVGINYRESLGIVVSENKNKLPKVWALRKDFPQLIHMDAVLDGMPKQLCLYHQSEFVTIRTWTAEKFLKVIYKWMEKSSVDALHFSDQPLEHLFFSPKHELILPSVAKNSPGEILGTGHIHEIKTRANNSMSFILRAGENKDAKKIMLIGINLEPVVHGTIQYSPRSILNLYKAVQKIQTSIEPVVREAIHKLVTEEGIEENKFNGYSTIFLLNIPLKRTEESNIEKNQLQAFFSDLDPINIGLIFNYLFKAPTDQKIYKELSQDNTDIEKDVAIDPLEVLFINSKEDFMNQSGNAIYGSNNTLVGLGALGSVLADLWTRCGWGNWTFVDKDHIKPHNITRHTANSNTIGLNKAELCAYLSFYCQGNEINFIDNDAMADDIRMTKTLENSSLIIDASTTVDYPRKVSFNNNFSRHCSVFLTPNGNDSVLMIEDKNRTIKLRSIEAQYYRFLLNDECGKSHLKGHLGSYITGMSCRDISYRLPFSSIMAHAANLSDKVIELSEQENQKLFIWKRNKSTGEIRVFDIVVHDEIQHDLGNYKVFFDEGLKKKLEQMRKKMLPNETGGILLGYHDFNHNAIFIVDALNEPVDSKSSPTSFQRGVDGCKDAIQDALERTAHIVSYIGEWHSHPPSCGSSQSHLDIAQLSNLSIDLSEDGLPAMQLIISESDINIIIEKAE